MIAQQDFLVFYWYKNLIRLFGILLAQKINRTFWHITSASISPDFNVVSSTPHAEWDSNSQLNGDRQ
jgi:hypothetical protein